VIFSLNDYKIHRKRLNLEYIIGYICYIAILSSNIE